MTAALLVDTVAWAFACRRLDASLHDADTTGGWIVESAGTHWAGWPLAAELVLPDADLRAAPETAPALRWTATRLVLRLSALHPTVLTLSASGAQSLSLAGDPPLPFTTDALSVAIDLRGADPVRVDLAGLRLPLPPGPIRIAAASAAWGTDTLSLDAAGIVVPVSGQPLEPPIAALGFQARLAPPVEPMRTPRDAARHWRDAGGRLTVDRFALRWGPLDATGHATGALDPALQPELDAEITATGLSPLVDRLAVDGVVSPNAAIAVRGLLAIFLAPAAGGPVTLPLALRSGTLTFAHVPVLRLPPLRWD